MKTVKKEKQYGSPNLLLRVTARNGNKDSFFYRESWQILRRFIFCFLFSLSVLPLWMKAFNLEVNWLLQALVLFLSYFLIYLMMRFSKLLSGIAILLLVLGIIGALVPELPLLGFIGKPIRAVFELIYNRLSYGLGIERELMQAGLTASAGFVVVLALLSALILLWRPLPLLGFFFSSMLFGFAEEISEQLESNGIQLAYAASILIILLVWANGDNKHKLSFGTGDNLKIRSNANEQSRRKRAIPISIIILSVLMLLNSLIPASAFYVKSVDDYMSRLFGQRYQEQSSIPYLQFSLRDLGYYPLENRLGGTPDLSDEPYMYLNSDARSIHLRGTAYLGYTGLGWTQDGMNPNWLMAHSRNVEAQKQILGQLHAITEGQVQEMLPDRSFELRPAREQQVIFHGGRPKEFASMDKSSFNVYFNQSGNLYLDRRITSDGYSGLGQWFSVRAMHEAANLETLTGLFPTIQMSAEERKRWVELPQLPSLAAVLEQEHPELEKLIYESGLNDAERVTAIRSYLADNFTYTLNVETPPDDRDFVTYFLESGEGYCTYFATALTVLLRSADIPARYVEGFLVPQAEGNLTRELNGKNGHAWTEVWFDTFGWVPLDATPAGTLDRMENRPTFDQNEPPPPTEGRPDPTVTVPQTEQIPGEEHTEAEELPGGKNGGFSLLAFLYFILKLLLYILIYTAPVWIYILWRYWVYKRRHDQEYLQKKLQETSIEDLISKIDLDLQSMWSLEGKVRFYGETIRDFVERMKRENENEIDQIYLDLTEKIYYADPAEKVIKTKELQDFLIFYDNEERRLKKQLPGKTWIFKRFLWSEYHPLPR